MSDLKILILGAGGRMGGANIRAIHETKGAVLSAAIERTESPHLGKDAAQLAGLEAQGVLISDDLDAAIAQSDAIIDFTAPQVSIDVAKRAKDKIHVVGTTGWTAGQDADIEAQAAHLTLVKSGNMSLGVNLLAALVEKAARALPDSFDIEVLEMHHRMKVDAPSGTALLLGEAAAKGRDIDLADNAVRSRDGITGERETGSIGFATLRGGTVTGEHDVIFAGEKERIKLGHIAEDRSVFAQGAIHAALWAKDKPNGLYSMIDVLGLTD